MLENYIKTQVIESQRDYLRKNLSKEAILKGLENKKFYSIAFKVKDNALSQKYFEVCIVDIRSYKNENLILMAFRNIDDLVKYSK